MLIERRSMPAQSAAGKITLSIPFESWSEDLGFRERIMPQAFTRSLSAAGEEIHAYWAHDTSKPLAKRSNGTLKLSANAFRLTAEITPDGASWGADAQRSIEAGTVSGSSFAFRTKTDTWYRQGGEWRRDLEDVDLIEVSPVASPAYAASTAATS